MNNIMKKCDDYGNEDNINLVIGLCSNCEQRRKEIEEHHIEEYLIGCL